METNKKNTVETEISEQTEKNDQDFRMQDEFSAKLNQISIGLSKLQISSRNDIENLEEEIKELEKLISEASKEINKIKKK